jgi:hypothetical protein
VVTPPRIIRGEVRVMGCGLWVAGCGRIEAQAELVFGVWCLVGAGRNERRSQAREVREKKKKR